MSVKQLICISILLFVFSISGLAQAGTQRSTTIKNSAPKELVRDYVETKNIQFRYPVRFFDLINDTLMLIHYDRKITEFTPV